MQSDISNDVLIQFHFPDDEHWVARNMQKREINKNIEKSASIWLLTRISYPTFTSVLAIVVYVTEDCTRIV